MQYHLFKGKWVLPELETVVIENNTSKIFVLAFDPGYSFPCSIPVTVMVLLPGLWPELSTFNGPFQPLGASSGNSVNNQCLSLKNLESKLIICYNFLNNLYSTFDTGFLRTCSS